MKNSIKVNNFIDIKYVICYILKCNILPKERRMNFQEVIKYENIDFSNTGADLFLLGLLSAFDNRYQAKADGFFKEISWKQQSSQRNF